MIYLRKLNSSDLSFLNYVENDHENWKSSNTISKFENKELISLINQSKLPISLTKQLRLVICKKSDHFRIGFIDLFDIDFKNSRSGVSLIVADKNNRSKGYGSLALNILVEYALKRLKIKNLYCNISNKNLASIKCFESVGFRKISFNGEYTKSLSKKFNFNSISQFVCT
jgi:diamine N-acetyltransferase